MPAPFTNGLGSSTPDDDLGNTRTNQRLDTGAGLTGVRAGLKRDISGLRPGRVHPPAPKPPPPHDCPPQVA